MILTLVRSQNRTIRVRAAYTTHLPLFISAIASCSGFSTMYLIDPKASERKVPCLVRALMKSSRPPAANASVSVSDFGISEKVEVKHVSSSWLFRTEWQIFVKDLPEDVGKRCVRKWVIFSKELATCDDSLGLSAICV
jgi:hypothetical protein